MSTVKQHCHFFADMRILLFYPANRFLIYLRFGNTDIKIIEWIYIQKYHMISVKITKTYIL